MMFFIGMSALIWAGGYVIDVPKQLRLATIGVLYLAILLALAVLPDPHPLRVTLDGTFGDWLVAGGAAILIFGYARLVRWLKTKTDSKKPVSSERLFSDTELDRYARHIVLRDLGGPGQKRLKEAKVLVIGAGGLGSPALLYLAAAGVGTIGVIDDDEVDNSNLQRQVIHTDAAIGTPKVFSAEVAMKEQTPAVIVRPYHRRLAKDFAADLISDYDLVLDGCDNFDTRYLVNRICAEQGIPLVSGALSQWEGQITVFDPANDAPCYECVFPEKPAEGLAPSCAQAGVLGPLPGVIGSMMAVEAVKVLSGAGTPMHGQMLIYDALYGETRQIRLNRRTDCPTCGKPA